MLLYIAVVLEFAVMSHVLYIVGIGDDVTRVIYMGNNSN